MAAESPPDGERPDDWGHPDDRGHPDDGRTGRGGERNAPDGEPGDEP